MRFNVPVPTIRNKSIKITIPCGVCVRFPSVKANVKVKAPSIKIRYPKKRQSLPQGVK